MTPARAGTSAVAGVLGVSTVLVLVTWAASAGPDQILRKPGPPAGSSFLPSDQESAGAVLGGHLPPPGHPSTPHVPGWVGVLAVLIQLTAVVVVLYLVARLAGHLWRLWRDRRRGPVRARPDVDFDVLDQPGELAAALEADAAEQRRLLEEGAPRNAIVACWHRLETTAERAGARRRTWQTPSEFVLAVLELARADGDAVLELAALYREARFSDHPLTEAHRDRALAALDGVQASLARADALRPVSGS